MLVALDLSVLLTKTRWRGIGRYLADLSEGLTRLGALDLQTAGILELPWSKSAKSSYDLQAAIQKQTHPSTPVVSHARWAYQLRLGLARAVRSLGADLVHTGHPDATPLGKLPCPRVTTCHDLIPLRYPEQYTDYRSGFAWGQRKLSLRRFASAQHVIAVSQATADDLMHELALSARKISVVHNGVDLTRFTPEPREEDRATVDRHGLVPLRYVLAVGGADWRKNALGMLLAVARLRESPKFSDLSFVWVGRLDPEWAARLTLAAREHAMGTAFKLLGQLSDAELSSLYRNAYCHTFVSLMEGFGYPIVEAMASGCPVVTSNCSSMAEVAGDAALTVEPLRNGAIASALESLGDDATRKQLIEAGLRRARELSLERMAEQTLTVYRSLA